MKKAKADSLNPLNVNVGSKDLLQIIVGAFVLAIPVGFTQEVWELGEILPMFNIYLIIILTLFFISVFTYYQYHREHIHSNPKYHLEELTKRVFLTYIISFLVVALLLWTINVTPWETNSLLAFKIVAIVTFPAVIGAVISDRL